MLPSVYLCAMQSKQRLRQVLEHLASPEHYLFSPSDFAVVFSELSYSALKALLSRTVADGLLKRVCRGIYLYDKVDYPRGLVLYHTIAKLRAYTFNYLSLETVLSEAGIISQVPPQWITVMTGGRSGIISCGDFGTIECVHTKRSPESLAGRVTCDIQRKLLRADVSLALEDMKRTGRSLDLVNWDLVDEFI